MQQEWGALICTRPPPRAGMQQGVESTDLHPPPPLSPRCCFKRGLSAGEEGKRVQERLHRLLRSCVVFFPFRGRATITRATIPTSAAPFASPALSPAAVRVSPRAALGWITRCRRQDWDKRQDMSWKEGAERKAASPPPRISYRREGKTRRKQEFYWGRELRE